MLPAASITSQAVNSQRSLSSSDGAAWTLIDNANFVLTPSGGNPTSTYAVSANADLWTANAGFNQDIAIVISGGVYGSGTVVAWKESGGFAGTFSPNAAYLETVQHLQAGVTYSILLAWKTNRQGAGSTIYAGAGPWPAGGAVFSPTRVTATLLSSP